MGAPNPDDPLANDVADHWKKDEKSAIEKGNYSFIFYSFILRFILSHGMDKIIRKIFLNIIK